VDGHVAYESLNKAEDILSQLKKRGYETAQQVVIVGTIAGPMTPPNTAGATNFQGNIVYQNMPTGSFLTAPTDPIPDYVIEFDWAQTFSGNQMGSGITFFDAGGVASPTNSVNTVGFTPWSHGFAGVQLSCGRSYDVPGGYGSRLSMIDSVTSHLDGAFMSGNSFNGTYHATIEIQKAGALVTATIKRSTGAATSFRSEPDPALMRPIFTERSAGVPLKVGVYLYDHNGGNATTITNIKFGIAK
jgi:hypothetical protein